MHLDERQLAPTEGRRRRFSMMRILKMAEVVAVTRLSESTIRRAMAAGTFPRLRVLGDRSRGFLESDILEWLESRPTVASGVPGVRR